MPLDEQVVAAIYQEHAPALRSFVLGLTSNPEQAEDVVQEAIVRVWQQNPEITTSIRSYLFRIARNIVIDNFRRQQRRPQQASAVDPEQLAVAVESTDSIVTKVLMEEALKRISPEHREVIVALHYQRLTVVEAAQKLRIPTGTAKSRAFYAAKSLRAVLNEMGMES
ncbi:MAG: sigma-70 family RNA polymerase sigma factor [Renibacterium sp.]|nr:sigma-70 family RNA polymerase sigma factor [Renibacterium sp.]